MPGKFSDSLGFLSGNRLKNERETVWWSPQEMCRHSVLPNLRVPFTSLHISAIEGSCTISDRKIMMSRSNLAFHRQKWIQSVAWHFFTFHYTKIVSKWNRFVIQEVVSKKVSEYWRPISRVVHKRNTKSFLFSWYEKCVIYFVWEISFLSIIRCRSCGKLYVNQSNNSGHNKQKEYLH